MEVKSNIIRFCDSSTLEKVSQVCLAFLELASPLLYEAVVLKGPEALESFFCERNPSIHQAQLEPFLSLSQTRSITFFPDGLIRRGVKLYKDRLSSGTLPLDILTLRPKAFESSPATPGPGESMPDASMWSSFLSLLNPHRVDVIGTRDDFSKPYTRVPDVCPREETLSWSRIEHLEFTNASASSFLGFSFFLVGRNDDRPLQVVYNLHQRWEDYREGYPVEKLLLFDLSCIENEVTQPDEGCPIFAFEFVRAVVRVRDEEEGSELMSDIEDGWDVMGVGNAEKRDWRRRLKIEIVQEEEDEDETSSGSEEDA